MRAAFRRFFWDDRGQDLVEYALLTAVIGFAGLAAFDFISAAIGSTYASWESGTNTIWHPDDPVSAGS